MLVKKDVERLRLIDLTTHIEQRRYTQTPTAQNVENLFVLGIPGKMAEADDW